MGYSDSPGVASGIEGALKESATQLNEFINSIHYVPEDATSDAADAGEGFSALEKDRGAGFYAVDPRNNEAIKVDDIDGQYRAGKITESATNLVQTSMGVEQADRAARNTVKHAQS